MIYYKIFMNDYYIFKVKITQFLLHFSTKNVNLDQKESIKFEFRLKNVIFK